MAFSSIFKTQSIVPKITKFSSSIFGSRKINQGSLISAGPQIGETLVETNRILVEIQKQLSLDFAYRVTQEQNDIKQAKADADAAKRFRAERKAEGILGKGGSFLGGLGSKIAAPVSNVWTRLLDFFTLIGTGLVATKGLKWLSENEEVITKTFKFLEDHWLKIAGGLAIVATISLLGKFVFLFKILKGLAGIAAAFLGIKSLWGAGRKPQLPPIDKSKIDKSKIDKSKIDKSKIDKSKIDKSKIDKSKIDKSKTPDKTKRTKIDKKVIQDILKKLRKLKLPKSEIARILGSLRSLRMPKGGIGAGLFSLILNDLINPQSLGDGTLTPLYRMARSELEPSVKSVLESDMRPVTKTNVTVLDTIRENTANMRNSSQTAILEGSNTPSVPLVRSQDTSNPLIWHTADMLGITEF